MTLFTLYANYVQNQGQCMISYAVPDKMHML